MTSCRYFAYGSNLCEARLVRRVPGARLLGPAEAPGYSLVWHKRSKDGSGKCSIVLDEGATIHGAIYSFPLAQKPLLDRVEGLGLGYDETEVEVRFADGTPRAYTYVAGLAFVDERLLPFEWYRELVVEGASSLGLPARYVERLERVEAIPDPDRARAARNRADLPCRARGAARRLAQT